MSSLKIWLFVFVMLALCFMQPASAEVTAEQDMQKTTEAATRYVNGRNLSKYLQDVDRPVFALEQIAKLSRGQYIKSVIEDYVAYENSIGGRDLRSDSSAQKYQQPDLTKNFSDFYGLNGANKNNPDEPVTANTVLDAIEGYLPLLLANNPEMLEKLKKADDTKIEYDAQDLENVAKRTRLSTDQVKAILKGMSNNSVASGAVANAIKEVDPRAQAFVRENFPNELKEAQRMRDNSEKYFDSYRQDIADYQKFLANMESPAFKKQFTEYAKFFTPDQREQAIAPYVKQAKEYLDRAKVNYQLGLRELEYMQQYLDRFQQQKLIPKLNEHNRRVGRQSLNHSNPQQLPRFATSGIFAFAAATTSSNSSTIDIGSAISAFSDDIGAGYGNGSSSVTSGDNGFNIQAADFSASGESTSTSNLSDASMNVANQNTGATAQSAVNSATGSSFSSAQRSKAGDLPPLAEYFRVDQMFKGNNYRPLCDDSQVGATGSQVRVTRFTGADCVERLNSLTPFASSANDYFTLFKTSDGTTAAASNRQVGLTEKKSGTSSLGDYYKKSGGVTGSFIKNYKGTGPVVTKSGLGEAHKLQQAVLEGKGYDVGANIKTTETYANEGQEEFVHYNSIFANDTKKAEQQAIELGYCLMIEDKDGDYNVSLNSSYNPIIRDPLDPRAKKYNVGSGKRASVQRIIGPHPFSPREGHEWIDSPNPLNSTCGGGNMITDVCGTDRKTKIGNVYAWEKALGAGWDRGYYKIPIVDNDGKILATPQRVAIYSTVGFAVYYACMAASYGSAQAVCCDIAEHTACQLGILPDVDPVNKLALTFGPARESGGGSGSSGSDGFPQLYADSYDSHIVGGFKNNGYNWYTSYPQEKFGNNGPWLKSVVTGEAGFGELKGNKRNWDLSKISISGVNPGYSMSEDNNSAPIAHNMSCPVGGWEELKRYQERCARVIGVNCICDPKVFYDKTAVGYVLSRYSGVGLNVDSKTRSKTRTVEVGGEKFSRMKDVTERVNWDAVILSSREGVPVFAQPGYDVGGKEGEKFPGPGSVPGLSEAKEGSMIAMYQELQGDFKRPSMVAFVESINNKTGCLTVTTMNNPSVFMDSCGGTENLGKVTEFEICPPNMKGQSALKHPGGKIPRCAENNEYYQCQEDQAGWNSWLVKNPYKSGGLI